MSPPAKRQKLSHDSSVRTSASNAPSKSDFWAFKFTVMLYKCVFCVGELANLMILHSDITDMNAAVKLLTKQVKDILQGIKSSEFNCSQRNL